MRWPASGVAPVVEGRAATTLLAWWGGGRATSRCRPDAPPGWDDGWHPVQKSSISEPLLAAAWQRALVRRPQLAPLGGFLGWRHQRTAAAFAAVDRLLVRSDAAVAALKPPTRPGVYSTGLSVAVVSGRRDEAAAEAGAERGGLGPRLLSPQAFVQERRTWPRSERVAVTGGRK